MGVLVVWWVSSHLARPVLGCLRICKLHQVYPGLSLVGPETLLFYVRKLVFVGSIAILLGWPLRKLQNSLVEKSGLINSMDEPLCVLTQWQYYP